MLGNANWEEGMSGSAMAADFGCWDARFPLVGEQENSIGT